MSFKEAEEGAGRGGGGWEALLKGKGNLFHNSNHTYVYHINLLLNITASTNEELMEQVYSLIERWC